MADYLFLEFTLGIFLLFATYGVYAYNARAERAMTWAKTAGLAAMGIPLFLTAIVGLSERDSQVRREVRAQVQHEQDERTRIQLEERLRQARERRDGDGAAARA